jgi:hypothetical protein
MPRGWRPTKTATTRNEISASANISPNTANQVPAEYQSLLQSISPIGPTVDVVTPGGYFNAGVWYTLGNVGTGFIEIWFPTIMPGCNRGIRPV